MSDGMEFLGDLLETLDMADLEPDEDGLYSFVVDDGLLVFLRPLEADANAEGGGIILFAGIGTIAADQVEGASRALLEANHFWAETGGFTFSLIPASLNVLLSARERAVHLQDGGLFDLFDRFVSAADYWRQKLPTLATNSPGAEVQRMMSAADSESAERPPSPNDMV